MEKNPLKIGTGNQSGWRKFKTMTPEQLEKARDMVLQAAGKEPAAYFMAIMLGVMPGISCSRSSLYTYHNYTYYNFVDEWICWAETPQGDAYWGVINRKFQHVFGRGYSRLLKEI